MSDSRWIDELAPKLPHVRPGFLEDVKTMSREELQRRILNGAEWLGVFASCLDNIPEIRCMQGSGIDGCRTHVEVRSIVSQLVQASPATWANTWEGQPKVNAPTPAAAPDTEPPASQ